MHKREITLRLSGFASFSWVVRCGLIVVVLALCLGLTACSQGNPGGTGRKAVDGIDLSQLVGGDGQTNLHDAAESGGFGLLVVTEGSDEAVLLREKSSADLGFATVDRASQRLVLLGTEPTGCAKASQMLDWGYCDSRTFKNLTDFDELDGVTFNSEEEAEEILNNAGFYIVEDDSSSSTFRIASKIKDNAISYRCDRGSDSTTGQIVADASYYVKGGGINIDSGVVHTQSSGFECAYRQEGDGYCVIDLSALEPGAYLLSVYFDGPLEYLIQVV